MRSVVTNSDDLPSTNDPLFWMHHAGMDRLWALWQEQEPSRLNSVSGSNGLIEVIRPFTLDTMVWMGFAAPDRPVRQLLDTQNRDGKGFLCYKYEGLDIEYYTG
jgi:tyrosinase